MGENTTELTMDAIPAVVAVVDVLRSRGHDCNRYLAENVYDDGDWDCSLCAALAPFVGEATQ